MVMNLLKKVLEKEEDLNINLNKIIDIINEGYIKNQNVKGPFTKKYSFAPSKLVWNEGVCPRFWYLAFEGNDWENKNTGPGLANMLAGIHGHERIAEALKDQNVIKWLEKEIRYENPPIFGKGDGMFAIDGQEILVEIKTTNDRNFEYRKSSKTASDGNRLQLLMYMKILKHQLGAIIYENKNTHELLVIPVVPTQKDVDTVNNLFDWMIRVKKAFDDKQLPERISRQGTKMCAACPVEKVCDSREKGDIKIEKRKDFE
jgi:CRISPR/Cas system-associated exonuclease Cas4 (RecB family)